MVLRDRFERFEDADDDAFGLSASPLVRERAEVEGVDEEDAAGTTLPVVGVVEEAAA